MRDVSVIVACHSITGLDRVLSNINSQSLKEFQTIIAYDKNEVNSILIDNTINSSNIDDVCTYACTLVRGKYEPVLSNAEMYIQAVKKAQGKFIILATENVIYEHSFIENMLKQIETDNSDICFSPLAVAWNDNDITIYDSELDANSPDYYYSSSMLSSLISNAGNKWWIHSFESKIIRKEFFLKIVAGLEKFYTRHNAHLELDSAIVFSEMMSLRPNISYASDSFSVLVWKYQDAEISNYFKNVNCVTFIEEIKQSLEYISNKLTFLMSEDNEIVRFEDNFISRLIWRVDWNFKEIKESLEKEYDKEFCKFSLDLIGAAGKKLSANIFKQITEFSSEVNSDLNIDLTGTENESQDFGQSNNILAGNDNLDIGIYISMHKPAYVPENNRFIVPIQVGTALSEEIFSGMQHDNDAEDNISEKNKMYCEMTAQYYVWKNIKDKDFYGFWHYRRYFSFNENEKDTEWGIVEHSVLDEESLRTSLIDEKHIHLACKGAEIIVPRKWHCVEDGKELTIYDHWCKHFNKYDMDITLKVILEKYPYLYGSAIDVLYSTSAIFCNMFIMDKDHFEEYNKFCFDVLFEVEKKINQENYNIEEYRTLGHIAERLLAFYVTYVENKNDTTRVHYVGRVQYKDTRPVAVVEFPEYFFEKKYKNKKNVQDNAIKITNSDNSNVFDRDKCISVMLACNDVYMIYTDVLLQSIKSNLNPNYFYDIVICHRDISDFNQNVAKQIFEENSNVLLRFADVSRNFDKYRNVHIDRHLTYETYYRFLVLDVFKGYDKVLYLDCDMIVNSDISKLFLTTFEDEYIAAVRDYDFIANCLVNEKFYQENILKHIRIDSFFNYFQAGMILFNLNNLRKDGFTSEYLFETALSRNWYFHDQDVLNCLFNGRIKYVSDKWNVFTLLENNSAREKLILKDLAAKYAESYKQSMSEPRIVHYAGVPKVWHDASIHLATLFWKYARHSPFYEFLLNTLNNGDGVKKDWILFTKQPNRGNSIHFFTVNTVKEAFSSNYCVIDFIYLSDHKNIITNTLIINVSVFPHQTQKFWLDVKEFRWKKDEAVFKDNIWCKTNNNFELEVYIREMDIYTGFSFEVRELQSRSINKPYINTINHEFVNT